MANSLKIIRTNSADTNFQQLVTELDKDLKIRDGEEHDFYQQFNKLLNINHVIMVYDDNEAVGCGAIKAFSEDTMEVKRMFVPPARRGQGIASVVLAELEKWAKEMGMKKCILETGKKQPEAISLYHKNGYTVTKNFGQYEHVENSVCFEKSL